jgi:hypothetical protein
MCFVGLFVEDKIKSQSMIFGMQIMNYFGFLETKPHLRSQKSFLSLCAKLNKKYPEVVSSHFPIRLFM